MLHNKIRKKKKLVRDLGGFQLQVLNEEKCLNILILKLKIKCCLKCSVCLVCRVSHLNCCVFFLMLVLSNCQQMFLDGCSLQTGLCSVEIITAGLASPLRPSHARQLCDRQNQLNSKISHFLPFHVLLEQTAF